MHTIRARQFCCPKCNNYVVLKWAYVEGTKLIFLGECIECATHWPWTVDEIWSELQKIKLVPGSSVIN